MSNLSYPMAEMLKNAQGSLRMHMPGHKGNMPPELGGGAWDMTEIAATDDLYDPTSAIREAQTLYARAANAGATLFVSGGATAGIIAMMLHALRPDDAVILERTAHHSAQSALVHGGLWPVYINPRVREDGISQTHEEDIMHGMEQHPHARAVLLTSPNYYGVCLDLAPIVQKARELGMCVMVDEAHGAHFPWFAPDEGPLSAGVQGADYWVQSAHKTLPALTMGATLHMRNGDEVIPLRESLRRVMTSSPSFPIMASIDYARAYMQSEGKQRLADVRGLCIEAKQKIHAPYLGFCDPTRLVFDAGRQGLSGYEASDILSQNGVVVEMADSRRVVAIVTVCDDAHSIAAFVKAIQALPKGRKQQIPLFFPAYAKQVLSPRDAVYAQGERVPLPDAVDRIASTAVGVYPPGVPLCCVGQRLEKETIHALLEMQRAGAHLFGVPGGNVQVVKEDHLSCKL